MIKFRLTSKPLIRIGECLNNRTVMVDFKKKLQKAQVAKATDPKEIYVQNKGVDASLYSYIHIIRTVLSDIRQILNDYDTKQIPKDGIASAIARAEAITKIAESTRFAEIRDILMGIRQSIVYY